MRPAVRRVASAAAAPRAGGGLEDKIAMAAGGAARGLSCCAPFTVAAAAPRAGDGPKIAVAVSVGSGVSRVSVARIDPALRCTVDPRGDRAAVLIGR